MFFFYCLLGEKIFSQPGGVEMTIGARPEGYCLAFVGGDQKD